MHKVAQPQAAATPTTHNSPPGGPDKHPDAPPVITEQCLSWACPRAPHTIDDSDGGCTTLLHTITVDDFTMINARLDTWTGTIPHLNLAMSVLDKPAEINLYTPAAVRRVARDLRRLADSLDQGADILAAEQQAHGPLTIEHVMLLPTWALVGAIDGRIDYVWDRELDFHGALLANHGAPVLVLPTKQDRDIRRCVTRGLIANYLGITLAAWPDRLQIVQAEDGSSEVRG